MLGSLRLDGPTSCMTFEFDGATDLEVFRAYTESVLKPTLQPGDVVILDNPSANYAGRATGANAAAPHISASQVERVKGIAPCSQPSQNHLFLFINGLQNIASACSHRFPHLSARYSVTKCYQHHLV